MKGGNNICDDSGFVDDCDIGLDDSTQFEPLSDDLLVVEDDTFALIESSVEALLQEEDDDLKGHQYSLRKRGQSCEVKSFLKTTHLAEPLDTSKPQRTLRKRGRPAKINVIEESINSGRKEELFPEIIKRKRGRPSKNIIVLTKANEEILLLEDSPCKKVKVVRLKTNGKKTGPSLPADYEMSPYEKIREANIKEREEMLVALGIKEAFDEYKNDVGLGRKAAGPRKQKVEQIERRRSSRFDGKDDADYVPEDETDSNEDPTDHTHDGLRKHPCKECVNCILPDCRKCVFCKDKRKYGGPNIKKQKCEYKEKCSQPIILCFICKGKPTFSCLLCEKQFLEMFQLEEHNKDIHQAEQILRRSSRLTVKSTPVY
eukprot:GFUD01081982.1.p1 GENE.GFUD01081982.1~~GFUD01081982.1.p1  ORF type:complete len:372 (-),score=104.08 GFUD01081982.1:51-1166(-)